MLFGKPRVSPMDNVIFFIAAWICGLEKITEPKATITQAAAALLHPFGLRFSFFSRFEGDGYSEEWKQEAARRGLTNICHVPEALMHYVDNQSKSVLIGERIFNETELNSRLEVELEKYTMKVQIEGRVLGDLAINHIVPTAVAYQNRLLENLRGMKEIFSAEEYEVLSADRKELIREISHRVTSIKILVREMTEARKVANHLENYKERAFAYEDKVRPYLDQIRDHIDHLEMEVDDEIWPLPKYRELLFTK